ncbi:hypothetical protein SESBI_20701 [Sesbania bispinosa]|nr:hypothetical protein SESBI_20701 [Sesbania bispinosa]
MSSEPPFFHRIIHNAWKSKTIPRSQYEGNLPISSSPSSVTRIGFFTPVFPQNHDSDLLPSHAIAIGIQIEKQDYLPDPVTVSPLTLPTKIVSLTFQAALGYQTMSTSQHQSPILGAAMAIAFAASFSVRFIKHSYPRLAAIVEKIGVPLFCTRFLSNDRGFLLWQFRRAGFCHQSLPYKLPHIKAICRGHKIHRTELMIYELHGFKLRHHKQLWHKTEPILTLILSTLHTATESKIAYIWHYLQVLSENTTILHLVEMDLVAGSILRQPQLGFEHMSK